jgi:DNA-binding transcriptional regulator YiaG
MTEDNIHIPTKFEIKAARYRAELTQAKAAELCHVGIRAWQMWEQGLREMPIPVWELFLIKIGARPVNAGASGSSD